MDDGNLDGTQQFFRTVNGRILELAESFAVGWPPSAEFLCECGDFGCLERLAVTVDEFRRVARTDRYLVLPGHEHRDEHRVVERLAAALVVAPRPRR